MSTAMLEKLLELEPDSDVSLQLQLRKKIAEAIIRGNFATNVPLPSSRKLSKQLHVARNTVVLAYEHLEDDGYLIAKERRGYFVNPEVLKGRAEIKSSLMSIRNPTATNQIGRRLLSRVSASNATLLNLKTGSDINIPLFMDNLIQDCFPPRTGVSVVKTQ